MWTGNRTKIIFIIIDIYDMDSKLCWLSET